MFEKYPKEFLEKNTKLIDFYFIVIGILLFSIPIIFSIFAAFGLI